MTDQEPKYTTHLAYNDIYRGSGENLTEMNIAAWGSIYKFWLQKMAGHHDEPLIMDWGAGEGHFGPWMQAFLKNAHYIGIDYSEQAIANAQKRFGHVPNMRMYHGDVLNLPPEVRQESLRAQVIMASFLGPSIGFFNVLESILDIRAEAEQNGFTPPSALMMDRIYAPDQLALPESFFVKLRYGLAMMSYGARNGFIFRPDVSTMNKYMPVNVFNQEEYKKRNKEHAANATGPKNEFVPEVKNRLQKAGANYNLGTPGENVILVIK